MNAVVQYIDLGRGPGYNRVCIKVGNYILAVTDSSDFLDDKKKAQKVADRINKKLDKDRAAIAEFVIKEEKIKAILKYWTEKMTAVVDWISPTPTKQPGHYIIKITIGDYAAKILTYETLYDRDDAQKIADKINRKIDEETHAIMD